MFDGIDPLSTTPTDPQSSDRALSQAWQDAVAHAHSVNEHDGPATAAGMIGQATDPHTGSIDTKALASAVVSAAGSDLGRASQAYTDLHAQLAVTAASAASSFESDVKTAIRDGDDVLKGTAQGLSAAGRDLLINNPILTKQWESTTSAWTGKGGFTQGLNDLLQENGIKVGRMVNASPPGSITPSSGVPQSLANNTNGSLARDAIADRLRAQGFDVQTEVPRNGGNRVVDVVADRAAANPRNNERLELESKVGRTGQSPVRAGQIAEDAQSLAENARLRGVGSSLETAGKVLRPVAVVADAYQIGSAFHQDGDRIGAHTGEAVAGVAGGWGGAVAGAEGGAALGAALGSVVPGLGTAAGGVVGGVIGGIVGGVGGDWGGRKAFDAIESWF